MSEGLDSVPDVHGDAAAVLTTATDTTTPFIVIPTFATATLASTTDRTTPFIIIPTFATSTLASPAHVSRTTIAPTATRTVFPTSSTLTTTTTADHILGRLTIRIQNIQFEAVTSTQLVDLGVLYAQDIARACNLDTGSIRDLTGASSSVSLSKGSLVIVCFVEVPNDTTVDGLASRLGAHADLRTVVVQSTLEVLGAASSAITGILSVTDLLFEHAGSASEQSAPTHTWVWLCSVLASLVCFVGLACAFWTARHELQRGWNSNNIVVRMLTQQGTLVNGLRSTVFAGCDPQVSAAEDDEATGEACPLLPVASLSPPPSPPLSPGSPPRGLHHGASPAEAGMVQLTMPWLKTPGLDNTLMPTIGTTMAPSQMHAGACTTLSHSTQHSLVLPPQTADSRALQHPWWPASNQLGSVANGGMTLIGGDPLHHH